MSASREKKARQEQLTNGYVDPKAKRAQEEKAMQRRSSILCLDCVKLEIVKNNHLIGCNL